MTQSYFLSGRNPVFYIAEIGGNHEGDFEYAKKLTDLAIDSGADAVKFQFYTGDTLVSPIEEPDRNAHFKKFELTDEQNLELIARVQQSGRIPMASVWNSSMLKWADLHLPVHKVGSGDLTCYPMLKLLASTGKPIILSTGLSSLSEVEDAVRFVETCDETYVSHRKLALLQCTSAYPTPDEDANINAMLTLKKEFGLPVGYSDHTLGSDAIEVAVALGAEIIEKHFTDSREGKEFRDHKVSLTADEVKKTLSFMRRMHILKGSSEKKLTDSEKSASHQISFRRSLYASRDIEKGEVLIAQDIIALRPAHGFPATRYQELVGKETSRSIKKFELIMPEALRNGEF